ncbi:hypothetical protein AKJ09_06815 [Labilithrix luteola]|uniref:Tetratricopeptide repeat protein n=1 Tax=Labilithrix luteola TaxID=1391654 RepID=A0A0K1Q3E3_9BACT|nr:hypothetical protein [Labilithrix luteola]AKV00152.1 hypothetical protein AKJ09_06815 [Labilithrix luteola]
MNFSEIRLTEDEANRLGTILDDVRAAARDAPSVPTLRALVRLSLLLGGHYSTGDDVAADAVEASSQLLALLDRERDPRAWAEALLDQAEALRALSVYPGDREGWATQRADSVLAALAALPKDERGDLRVRVLLAAAEQVPTREERVRLCREAVAIVAPYRTVLVRRAATALRKALVADGDAEPRDVEAAFESELPLFESRESDGVFQDFVDVQQRYGHWLLDCGETERAITQFQSALAILEKGSHDSQSTKEFVLGSLARAKKIADASRAAHR